MKVKITSVSTYSDKREIIEVNSIDEAIKRVQTDKTLVQSVINTEYSWFNNTVGIDSFIIHTDIDEQNYDIELIIYDYYLEQKFI